jgi:hypothetical protein
MRIAFPTRALALSTVLLSMLLLSPALARADIGEKIILRCTHGESLRGFTQSDYNKALKELETSLEEYSGCASLIHQAQLAAAASRGGSGSSGGGGGGPSAPGAVSAPAPATPAEQSELNSAPSAGSAPLQVGNQVISPGVVHANIASAFTNLPNPLLAILIFLFASAIALVGGVIRNHVRDRHSN